MRRIGGLRLATILALALVAITSSFGIEDAAPRRGGGGEEV
jgi:hypothetical protein